VSFHPVNGRDAAQATFGRTPLKHSRSRSRSNKNRISLTDVDEETGVQRGQMPRDLGVQRSPMPRDLGVQRSPMPRDLGNQRSSMSRDLGVQGNQMPRDIEELVRMSVFNELKKQQQTRYFTVNNVATIDLHLLHNKILK
jgi:hypothetical protein